MMHMSIVLMETYRILLKAMKMLLRRPKALIICLQSGACYSSICNTVICLGFVSRLVFILVKLVLSILQQPREHLHTTCKAMLGHITPADRCSRVSSRGAHNLASMPHRAVLSLSLSGRFAVIFQAYSAHLSSSQRC